MDINTTSNITLQLVPGSSIQDHEAKYAFFFIIIQCVSLMLSLAVQFAIHRSKLNDNNYRIICYASIADSCYILISITIALVVILPKTAIQRSIEINALLFSDYSRS